MRRVVHVPDVTVQDLPRHYGPVHLPPHIGAVINVVLLRHVQLLVRTGRDGRRIRSPPRPRVQVPLPVLQRQEVVHQVRVETPGRQPGE